MLSVSGLYSEGRVRTPIVERSKGKTEELKSKLFHCDLLVRCNVRASLNRHAISLKTFGKTVHSYSAKVLQFEFSRPAIVLFSFM